LANLHRYIGKFQIYWAGREYSQRITCVNCATKENDSKNLHKSTKNSQSGIIYYIISCMVVEFWEITSSVLRIANFINKYKCGYIIMLLQVKLTEKQNNEFDLFLPVYIAIEPWKNYIWTKTVILLCVKM